MDEIVVQAMAKWPNVPAAYGWLRLDRRGTWHLIDRNAPGFDEAVHGGGTRLEHAGFADTICRNYQADEHGRWYFQNGPQRVFVDLEIAPLILRVLDAKRRGGADPVHAGAAAIEPAEATLVAHTGYPVSRVTDGAVDSDGNVFLNTDLGPGVVHDSDLASLPLEPGDSPDDTMRVRLGSDTITLRRITQDAAAEFGFVRMPRP